MTMAYRGVFCISILRMRGPIKIKKNSLLLSKIRLLVHKILSPLCSLSMGPLLKGFLILRAPLTALLNSCELLFHYF